MLRRPFPPACPRASMNISDDWRFLFLVSSVFAPPSLVPPAASYGPLVTPEFPNVARSSRDQEPNFEIFPKCSRIRIPPEMHRASSPFLPNPSPPPYPLALPSPYPRPCQRLGPPPPPAVPTPGKPRPRPVPSPLPRRALGSCAVPSSTAPFPPGSKASPSAFKAPAPSPPFPSTPQAKEEDREEEEEAEGRTSVAPRRLVSSVVLSVAVPEPPRSPSSPSLTPSLPCLPRAPPPSPAR